MDSLFEPKGRRALDEVMSRQPLLAFDFDGTLAPIVARPVDACVPVALSRRLARLAERYPVAIVTGRSVADVRPRLGFAPLYVIGNHGAEDPALPVALATPGALTALRARLQAQAAVLEAAGVQVEDKGASLALHYRLAPDRKAAREILDALVADLDPTLRAFGGKCVINVVADHAPDKGDAVAALLQRTGCRALVFIGDDLNDEAVYERAGPHWLTVKIGREGSQSRARYFLDSQAEVETLLDQMLTWSAPSTGTD